MSPETPPDPPATPAGTYESSSAIPAMLPDSGSGSATGEAAASVPNAGDSGQPAQTGTDAGVAAHQKWCQYPYCVTCGMSRVYHEEGPMVSHGFVQAACACGATDAGVAELIARLREAMTVLDEPFHHDAIAVVLGRAADVIEYQAAALAQQATQLQEARAQAEDWQLAADGIKHHFHCANNVVTGDPRGSICDRCRAEAAESQLTSLRAELETAQQARYEAQLLVAEFIDAYNPCALHRPEVWQGDGGCCFCEGQQLFTALAEARRALDEATDT